MTSAKSIPVGHHGSLYYDVMREISAKRSTKNYLEIGVSTGLLLQHIYTTNAFCVDPFFNLSQNFMTHKEKATLFQMTSDAFFRDTNALKSIDGAVDLAFLDGMHTFEYLLRDFYNTEAICGAHSLIAMHDCLPLNVEMAHRNMGTSLELGKHSAFPDFWTGDVWKIVPILKKYRPDLKLLFVDAPPTGVVFVTNLDNKSHILEERYNEIVDEFRRYENSIEHIEEMYNNIDLLPTLAITSDFNHSLWFKN